MGQSHTISEIDGDFSRKFIHFIFSFIHNRKIFRPSLYFCAPGEGVPLGIGYRRWESKYNDRATGPTKKFDNIFSRVDNTVHQRDGQTYTGRQQRPYAYT